MEAIEELRKQLTAANLQCEKLREYARHGQGCLFNYKYPPVCTCGLDAIINPTEEGTKE